ncbi:3-hydroxyisobutyrate dehydrogenase [Pseudomonas aeruginosa 3576]|nr:3-hydroxyisobutyrate dehydrogenase [Pseudomonas aeruginosa BWHPSA046]EZO17988.1 3-hydroxyisobutyrate dehydrogenase [Pseudomonas aeruginosa 3576]EZO99404.1 3-hydroxyisobutyrate dehydrogenase [Pseudomonas aeruginosa BWH052]MDA1445388.1 2-hydroxy-3-oxopropionate reductase [Pseudomonas aeruginosa]
MKQIAFIGLGHMGAPMATNLLKAGYLLNVFDLVQSAVDGLVAAGASAARSARDAVQGADVVISMLPASQHVEGLYLDDDGLLAHIAPGTLVLECSTIAPTSARKVHAAARERGLAMLDAPVSGGTAGAAAGTLTFMVGGDAEALEKARPLFEAMGRNIFHAGPDGAGQVAKVCNNQLLAVLMIGTAEAGPGRGQRPRREGAGRDHAPQLRWQLGAGSLQPLAGGYGERSGVARLQRRLHGPVDGQGPRAGPGSRPGQRQQHADGQPGAEPVPSAAEAGLCGAGLFRGAEIVRSDPRPIDRQAGPRPGWSIRRCEEPALNALLLRYRFRLLFFSTVLFTAILGLPSSTKPRVLGSLLLLVLAGMNTLRRRSPLVYLTAFFGLFSLALYTTADFSSPYSSLPPGLLRGLSLILLYLTLFAALFRRVTQERPVTHELLYGLCALYLQMALAFALAYYMVEQMQPASFIASHGALGLDTFVYYSLVTLTTVGYGDIQAINPLARLLAGSEGVIGVLFIALAVARSLTLMSDSEEV